MTNEDFWSTFSYPYTIDGEYVAEWSAVLKMYADNLHEIDNVPQEYTLKVRPIFDITESRG